MTAKRNLILAAVLLVIVAVGLLVLVREPEPDPPFTATFVRYDASNTAVIRITSKSHFDLYYCAIGSFPKSITLTNRLRSLETRETTVNSATASVSVICIGGMSKIQMLLRGLARKAGKRGPTLKSWEISLDLPACQQTNWPAQNPSP